MKNDSAMHRASVDELTPDELDKLVVEIRERRMLPVKVYEKTLALKKTKLEAGLRTRLDKQMELLSRDIERVDKAMDRLEKRAFGVRALRIEIDGEIM
jgi:hypothetical protein